MKTRALVFLATIMGLLAPLALRAGEADVKLLTEAPLFVYGPKGEWADDPPVLVAFKNVYIGADAVKQFTRIHEEGTPAGKMYALAGLSRLDRALYDKLKAEGESTGSWKDFRHVRSLSGCMLGSDSFERLTKALEAGNITELFPKTVTAETEGPLFVPAPSFDLVR